MLKASSSISAISIVLTLLSVVGCGADLPAEASGGAQTEGGEDAQEFRLAPAGRSDESFGLIQTVRELPDGRVLIADPLGKSLQVVDLDAGSAEVIGSEGQGPDEYRQPDAVWPLPGGRTLLVDLGNARLTVLEPDFEFGRTYPLSAGRPGPGGGFQVRTPSGVDAEGRIYFQTLGMGMDGQPPEFGTIMRWDPEVDEVTEVGEVRLPQRQVSESGGAGNRNRQIRQVPLSAADGWAVAADGRIAVARVEGGYRLDWIDPEGEPRIGPAQDFRPVRIGTAEKEEWVETQAERGGGLAISIEMDNDRTRMSFQRGASDRPDITGYEWPETKPAFDPDDILVDPDGRAWVRRHGPAGEPPHYDVFDETGALVGGVQLDPGRRVVGFGDGTVYVVQVDEYDLQYLERYRIG